MAETITFKLTEPRWMQEGVLATRVMLVKIKWLSTQMRELLVHQKSVAPVKTGRFRDSHRVRPVRHEGFVGAELYSLDPYGKVFAIEYGHTRTQPNREGRFPFKRTADHFEVTSTERLAELGRDLGGTFRGRV